MPPNDVVVTRILGCGTVVLILWVLVLWRRQPLLQQRAIRTGVEARGAELLDITALPRRGWLGSRDPATYSVQYRKQNGDVVTARCTIGTRGGWHWSGPDARAFGSGAGAHAAPPPL